ncbi:MAG: transcription antitermination factor NusB, partial [Nitrospira sp.]|nr:transcription antitermination factor NusB [Nitrospira sp.]
QFDVTRKREGLVEHFWMRHKAIPAIRDFADRLVEGVLKNIKEIDGMITKYTQHWSLDRIATVDRNILRFAIYEILYMDDVPAKVTINEAIEITKKYADQGSSAFINGILDKIVREESRALWKKEAIERDLHAGNDSL